MSSHVAEDIVSGWAYAGGDPGLELFTACLAAGAPMVFPDGGKVLEIGCCEADWLHPAAKAWPMCEFTGIDTRAPDTVTGDLRVYRVKANALDPDLFEPESFDAIVSLSAIEHMGLGHYGDPKDPDGDSKVLANCWRWLKPGGWMYFDVPYDPTGYRVVGTECRVYDDLAIETRLLWVPTWTGYVAADAAGTLIDKPTTPHKRYYYVANVWKKAA